MTNEETCATCEHFDNDTKDWCYKHHEAADVDIPACEDYLSDIQ